MSAAVNMSSSGPEGCSTQCDMPRFSSAPSSRVRGRLSIEPECTISADLRNAVCTSVCNPPADHPHPPPGRHPTTTLSSRGTAIPL